MDKKSVRKSFLSYPFVAIVAALAMSATTVASAPDNGRPVSDYVLEHIYGESSSQVAAQAEGRAVGLWLDIAAPLGIPSGQFPVLETVTYDLESGEVRLVVNGLVTCFDHETASSGNVRVVALDVSGFPRIDSEIKEPLAYLPSMNVLSYDNRPDKACFWETPEASGVQELSLFGTFQSAGNDQVFHDNFELPLDQATSSVSLSLHAVDDSGQSVAMPEQASVGDKITYRITIVNTGNRNIDHLGFQELLVNNSYAVPALLTFVQDSITCTATGGASCGALPKEIEMPGFPGDFVQLPYLRGDHDDGLVLPVESSITFELTRRVETGRDDSGSLLPPGDVVGEVIDLSFVAVALDGIDIMPGHDVLQHQIEVIAEGSLQADPASAESTVGEIPSITIQVVDDALEPVAWEGIDIFAEIIAGEAELLGENPIPTNGSGQASFELTSTTANEVTVEFIADGVTDSGEPAVTTSSFDFQAGPVTALRFEGADEFPETFQVGQILPDLLVSSIDEFGNISSSLDGSSVQLNLLEVGQFVYGWIDDREDLVSGQVVFSGLQLPENFSGPEFSLQARRGSDAEVDSPAFAIVAE